MSNSKSDKPLALKTIFGSLIVIVLWYILLGSFSHQVGGNFKNTVYLTVFIIAAILFISASIWAYTVADSATNDNKSRKWVIGITVFICLWAGGWVAGSNEKVAPGSPQLEDSGKTLQGRNFKANEYVSYLDSLSAIPNMLVFSDNYSVVVIDTTIPNWREVLASMQASQHKTL